jgi:hypothetical protein
MGKNTLKRSFDDMDNNMKYLNLDNLSLNMLLYNSNIDLIFDKICNKINDMEWSLLYRNENAINIIINNQDKLKYKDCWYHLCSFKNINAIRFIADNTHLLIYKDWVKLCKNEKAISILETNIDFLIKNDFLSELCLNINATNLIEKYLNLMDEDCWVNLSLNKNAYTLLKNNLDKLIHQDCWINLCFNENIDVINDIIKNNLNKINDKHWLILSKNPFAINLIKENINKINKDCCFELCKNSNPDVCDILKNYLTLMEDELDFWHDLTDNYYNNPSPKLLDFIENTSDYNCDYSSFNNIWASSDAMSYIEKNIDKLDSNPDSLYMLCTNKNAIHIIEKNIDKFDQHCWERLCSNINAMPIIMNNLDKLNKDAWITLSGNPNIVYYL